MDSASKKKIIMSSCLDQVFQLFDDILIRMKDDDQIVIDNDNKKIDNICEECKNEDETVKQNLIMYSYKICNSCNLSKRIFPL